jgi:RNA polymerase sigma-70 factor (ECF subfamily)
MGHAAIFTSELVPLFDAWRAERSSSHGSDGAAQSEYAGYIARIRAGDIAAFETLVVELSSPLVAYARRFTVSHDAARDIVQDVFTHLWTNRSSLTGLGGTRAYLYRAVRNRAFDVRKHERIEERTVTSHDPEPITTASDADVYRREVAERVGAAFAALSPRVREVAILRWRDGLGRAEIATIMGVAIPTVNNQLTQAARIMRELLSDLREPA